MRVICCFCGRLERAGRNIKAQCSSYPTDKNAGIYVIFVHIARQDRLATIARFGIRN